MEPYGIYECKNCKKLTNDLKMDTPICGKCRKVTKAELVHANLGLATQPRIYLDEENRNKNGRPSVTQDQKLEVPYLRNVEGKSIKEIASKCKLGRSTVYKILHGDYD